ncbi:MAG: hypothetical protein GF329_14290 [Candidatus Lokiarchaeota archaeon]|nr:hypothetical protein [Candidatus Lokiarchaeota archaeon]
MAKENLREKVGPWARFLARLGKHLMFWRQSKMSKLLINLAYREIIRLLIETEGDLETALKVVYKLCSNAGRDFLMEWVEEGSAIFSKHVGDHAHWIKAGYYSFTGDNIKYIEYFPPEKEGDPHRVVWRFHDDECFVCAGMEEDETLEVKAEDFGEMGWCVVIAGIFQTTVNMINEYVGIKYKGIVKETRCKLKGHDFDEFIAEFYPTE